MKYNFGIDKFQIVEENSNSQFATIEFDACRSGNNSHRLFISKDAIKYSAPSIKGKPILASMRYDGSDFRGHETDEIPVGFFEEKDPTLFEKDGETYIRAKGKIWKKYFENVMDVLKRKNGETDVSMEVEMLEGEDASLTSDGHMDLFAFQGVTMLGVKPSIQGAKAKVLSFSELKNNYYKEQDTLSQLQEFSERRKQEFMAEKTYKVNKTELKETAWGDVDKIKLRDAVMSAKNKATLVHDVYALVEDGWEESPSEHLKYPIMELVGDTFYYNRYGLASALAYAKKENETEVIGKVMKLYKKFKLDDREGEKKEMEKKFEIEGRKAWGEIIKEVQDHKKGAYVDSVEKDHIIYTVDGVRYRVEADVEVGKDDKTVHAKIDWKTVKKDANQKEFEDDKKEYPEDDAHSTDKKDEEEVEDDDKEVEKKMSLDANTDMAAYYEMLKDETSSYKDLARRVLEDEERGLVMQDVLKMAHECEELRSFKEQRMNEMRDMECNKLMAEVKDDLDEKQFEDMKAECMACKYEDVTGIANKYRAMAYARAKEKMAKENKVEEPKQFARMGFDFSSYITKSDTVMSADEIFKKYL